MGVQPGQKKYKWLDGPKGLHKPCSQCHVDKPASEYIPDRHKAIGYTSECRECHARQGAAWAQSESGMRSRARYLAKRIGAVLVFPDQEEGA